MNKFRSLGAKWQRKEEGVPSHKMSCPTTFDALSHDISQKTWMPLTSNFVFHDIWNPTPHDIL